MAALTLLLLAACTSSPPPTTPDPLGTLTHADLAAHYAPLIHQGAASDQDYIAAADFDGNWISNDNWEHQPTGDLSAHVYYSVVETESHAFLFYSLFHPRDYTREPCDESDGCHENDLESIQLVILKDGTPFGHLLAMETLAHGDIYLYTADPSVGPGYLDVAGEVHLADGHPVIYVETYGHGIYGQRKILLPHTVTYRVGAIAETPESTSDDDVLYRLVSIHETLWAHREAVGPGQTFDVHFYYRGHLLPAAFDGDNYGEDKANTPWGYPQALGDLLSRGDWLLDPVKAWGYHADFADGLEGEYTYNPYLTDLTNP